MDIRDEDDFVIDVDDEINRAEADDLLEDECCYCLYKNLRGRNIGRKLKRKFFKFCIAELVCGFGILVIAAFEDRNLGGSAYMLSTEYGATLLELQFWVSVTSLIIGIVTFFAVKYWASLVTNRDLFVKLQYINIFYLAILFIITLWCTAVLFLTFKDVDWEEREGDTEEFFLPFIFTVIFICPYLLAMLLYILDFSKLLDDVELGGNIVEPDVSPSEVKNLSGMSLKDFFAMIFAVPLLILVQFWHCCEGMMACCHFCTSCGRTAGDGGPSICERMSLASGSFFRNVRKQIKKRRRSKATVSPSKLEMGAERSHLVAMQQLAPTRSPDKEKTEEQLANEMEQERIRKELEDDEQVAKVANDLKVKESAANEKMLTAPLPMEAAPADLAPVKQQNEMRLTANHFRSLWSVVETSGSFQCKIKFSPSLNNFTEHMKRQGFHVVFANSPPSGGIEVGICNIRTTGDDAWFMARFLASPSNFSAVMKCQDPAVVEKFVKKFALAKILKIET